MNARVLWAGVAIVFFAWIGVAEAKKAPPAKGTGTLEVTPTGFDGEPLKKNSISLWQQVPADATKKDLWHDAKTDTWWKSVHGFATSGSSTFANLQPGKYRVAVREGHAQTGAFGLSEPIAIDASPQKVLAKVQVQRGGTLHLKCIDAGTNQVVPPPYLVLSLEDDSFWKGSQFAAEPVVGQHGQFEFHNLPLGKYHLNGSRRAASPDDAKYDLVGGEIEFKIASEDSVSRELKFKKSKPTEDDIARDWPYVVYGKVTDKKGQPIADAVVRAHTGFGTMFESGATVSRADGRYRLYFREGGMSFPDQVGQAIISASKPGMEEVNLNQQGEVTLASKKSDKMTDWLAKRPLVLAKQPHEITFVLSPDGKLSVRINRENREDLSGLDVSLKGDTMPPGCSVVDSGTTSRWGEVTFAEVPLDKEWWLELETKDRRTVRTQPFRLTEPQRYELVIDWRNDETGIEVLDITSFTDSLGRDQTLALVGDDRLAHAPASAADQQQVREWLKKIADVNRLWLAPPPAEVADYHYDFHIPGNPARRYEVPANRKVAGVVFHGIAYVSAVHYLTENPENVVARRIDRSDGRVSVSYRLREPVSISAGNGVLNSYRGFFSRQLRNGIIEFDPKNFQVFQHSAEDLVDRYSDYVGVGKDRFVPRTIEVEEGGKPVFRWSFAMYEPGLWLLDRSLARDQHDEDGLVRIDNVVINGAPPVRWHAQ